MDRKEEGMRCKLIVGNWKMNGLLAKGLALAEEIAERARRAPPSAEVVLCPPFTLLGMLGPSLAGSPVSLGGQDCDAAKLAEGAFTGAISAAMLADLGCRHVILGHSERRIHQKESDALIRAKAEAALAAGLVPVLCLGESASERERGEAERVVLKQLHGGLPEEVEPARLVLAYEPVWAIGTGKTASPADAVAMHGFLRRSLGERRGTAFAQATRLLYGGSVKPENAAALLGQEEIDGALVGGASLKAEDFWAIVTAAG